MKGNRNSLLERLYAGEFFPAEQVAPGDPDYVSIGHKVGDEIEYVSSRLDDEDKARFKALVNLMGDMETINDCSSFAYGLRTGIQLMMELFFNEGYPLFRERE